MNNHKRILSLILALILALSTFTPVFAQTTTPVKKTRTGAQEVQIGDEIYYIFSTDKNAKNDLIKSQEKSEKKTQAIQTSDGLDLSDNLFGRPVGAGQTTSYTLNIKGSNFKGVGGKTFDWDTLPEGLELQVFYIDEEGFDYNVGNPITINKSNYQDVITRTFDIAGQPFAFGMKTNVDTETYLTDAYLTNENSPEPGIGSLDMTFDLVQVPSTKLDVKWVDVNQQPLARENTPATSLKDILTFNFIENKKFDLPNQDKVDSYFRLNNKIKREEVKDIKGATALVDSKKDGEEVTLDGKIYKLTTSYDPAFNQGSKIQLMYMPDVIDRTKNPESPTPDKYVRVTIDAGEGTKLAEGETKKVYDVRVGKSLKAEHYPKLEISDSAKYKEPITWTIAPGTAITKAENIKGNAAKTAAETITAENLKAVDTTALQGQELDEKFWHKGVVLADNTPADKKDAFAALLKDATVTDITDPARTTAEAGDKVGTLLVTFKDGSTLQVPKQKLIVKPNTVTVAFDKAAGKEHPLRDGDTTVKGTITADSNTSKFPVSVDGAVVTIKKGNTVLTRTLANADGSFVAGVKDPLVAGDDISVVVTLPESKTESAPVTEKVQLNPDKLNEIIPTGQAVVKNLKGKKGVDQAKVTKLEEEITKAFTLVDKAGENQKQEDQKVKSTVGVNADGQKSLDDQYKAIKKAIEELTGNHAPEVKGTTSHKEIFKGDDLDLEKGITVTDKDGENDIALQGDKKFTYTVEKIGDKGAKEVVADTATINQTPGTYEVTYTAKDKSGAEGKFVMTLVVKKTVIEVPGEFPEETPDGYVKVEFKEGDHGKLEGTTKFLVKDGSAKTVLNAPTIKPNANYEATKDANWKPVLPETFTGTEENKKSFTFTAQYTYTGSDVVPQKPGDEKPDVPKEFVKVEFKKGDHGVISSEYTTIYWVNPEGKKTLADITKPKEVTAFEGYKFTGWDKEDSTKITTALDVTAQYKAKVVEEEPKIDDPEKPGEKITDPDYAKLTFNKGDNGEFVKNAKTEIWVLKNEEVKFNAPGIEANDGFVFNTWDPELLTKYTEDKTHTAKYEPKSDISDVPVAGFQEVKFLAGTDGKFENDKTEKSVWVRPGVKVDLTTKAPKVTVTNDKKGFVGWDKKLVGTFAKADTATEIKAVYKDKVLTEEPEDKTDYAEVKFVAGEHGTFANAEEKTKFWVLKGEQVTADFKAPTVTAKDGYTFDKWDPEVKTSYDKDQTHTATYKTNSSISDDPVEGFQEVKFLPGTDGKFEGEKQVKSVWVEPGVLVDLRTKAPKVTANEGKVHTGWDRDLVGTFKLETENGQPKATEITAKYKDKVVTKDPKDKNYVTVEFLAGAHGKFEQVGDPKKDQTTKFWVYKNEKVTFNAPTVTPADKYSFIGWKEPVQSSYSKDTTHTAQYSNTISDKYVEGWTEITFNSGDHGRFVADAKTVKWVDPKAGVKLSDMAPGITPDTNYSFKAWTKPGEGANAQAEEVALDKVAKYDKATTFTATYESDISDEAKEGFVKVIFAPGENGKFINEDGIAITGEVSTHVRKDVTVDLREKAPKVMPNTEYGHTGWDKDLAKVNVSKETTITATYTKGKFDDKNITAFEILGPKKAAYAEGDNLDLTDFTVVAIDKAGIRKEYTVQGGKLKNGKEELAGVTLKVGETTIDLANLPELNHKAHDNKPITLTKDGKDYNSTVHLSVSMTKTNQPTDLVAANQGENPTETKIKGKAQKGDTVKIYVPGNDKPIKEVVVTNEDGTFETSVSNENKPYDVGTKFNVTATGKDKAESTPQEVKVIKDVNSDWKDDGEGQKTATPTAKAFNQNIEEGGKVTDKPKTTTTIIGTAEKGAKVVAKVDDTVVGEATADQEGNYTIEATKTGKPDGGVLDLNTEVKVTAQADKKLVSDATATIVKRDADNNKKDDKTQDFDITKVEKLEIVKQPKLKYTAKDEKDGKTKFKLDLKDMVIRLTDKAGKEKLAIVKEDGKFYDFDNPTKEITELKADPAHNSELKPQTSDTEKGDSGKKIKITGPNDKFVETNELQVFYDANGDNTPDYKDGQKTQTPSIMARNIGENPDKTTVEGLATPGAVIKITDKDGRAITTEPAEIVAGPDGKYTAKISPKLNDGTEIKATAKLGEMKESDPAETTVFDDVNNDKIRDGQTERPAAIASNVGSKPTFTTIKGKTEPGAVITVTLKDGTKVKVDKVEIDAEGNYTLQATVGEKPLDNGAEILVYAQNAPKKISEPQTTTVFNDFNNDGKPDGGKVDLEDVKDIQVIAPDKMSYTQGEKLDGTGLKAVVRDNGGNIEIFDYDNTTGKFKNADNEEVAEITATVDGKAIKDLALTEKDHNGKAIDVKVGTIPGSTNQKLEVKQLQTPTPTIEFAANQNEPGLEEGTVSETAKDKTTVKFTVVNVPVKAYIKYKINGEPKSDVVTFKSNDEKTKVVDLSYLVPEGDPIEIIAIEEGKLKSEPARTNVIRDSDNDGKADPKYLPAPTIDPIRDKQATVSGEAKDAATVDIYKKNKTTNEWELIKEDENVSKNKFSYTNPTPFNDGDEIKVVAKRPNYVSAETTTTVGVDTSGLDKAIQDGKDALDPEKGGKNNGTPEDKALEDAIKKGEDLKKKDPAPTQDEVDKAQKDIEKAIEDKKAADEARDKLQEKINEANGKKNDPAYPTKPDDVKKELDDAAKDGQKVHDDSNKSKEDIEKEIEKIQEKIDQYNKQQIGVNIDKIVSTSKDIKVIVTAPNAKVEVFKVDFDYDTYEEVLTPIGKTTSITRVLIVTLNETLPKGTDLFIKVTHPDYLSYESTITVE